MGKADDKAKLAANADLIDAAGKVAGTKGIRAASAHIGATQGHKARMDALRAEFERRR
jgi:hypothetical protein